MEQSKIWVLLVYFAIISSGRASVIWKPSQYHDSDDVTCSTADCHLSPSFAESTTLCDCDSNCPSDQKCSENSCHTYKICQPVSSVKSTSNNYNALESNTKELPLDEIKESSKKLFTLLKEDPDEDDKQLEDGNKNIENGQIEATGIRLNIIYNIIQKIFIGNINVYDAKYIDICSAADKMKSCDDTNVKSSYSDDFLNKTNSEREDKVKTVHQDEKIKKNIDSLFKPIRKDKMEQSDEQDCLEDDEDCQISSGSKSSIIDQNDDFQQNIPGELPEPLTVYEYVTEAIPISNGYISRATEQHDLENNGPITASGTQNHVYDITIILEDPAENSESITSASDPENDTSVYEMSTFGTLSEFTTEKTSKSTESFSIHIEIPTAVPLEVPETGILSVECGTNKEQCDSKDLDFEDLNSFSDSDDKGPTDFDFEDDSP